MSQRLRRPAIMGMPQTATPPENYTFFKPREFNEKRLIAQLDKLRTNSAKNQSWSMLKNNLNVLWNLIENTQTMLYFQGAVEPTTEEVLAVIEKVANSFHKYIGVELETDLNTMLRKDIYREVSYCSRPSSMSRLLLLYAGGKDHWDHKMVFQYKHYNRYRPTKKEREGSTGQENEEEMVTYYRFRPSSYPSMAACSALQHAITRHTDNGGKPGRALQTQFSKDAFNKFISAGSVMDSAADTFLGKYFAS